tara:strand:- start:5607 stop:5870 length:264 start_codon:yes stop_codon:yes gene_type:complete
MPLYTYDCLSCKKMFDIRHSYNAKKVRCILCESENIKKNLSDVLRGTKRCYNSEEKVGSQVKKAIDEGKEGLKEYKEMQKSKVYSKK